MSSNAAIAAANSAAVSVAEILAAAHEGEAPQVIIDALSVLAAEAAQGALLASSEPESAWQLAKGAKAAHKAAKKLSVHIWSAAELVAGAA